MGVYIWKDIGDTLTISWEEKSDMSSWWTYSDGAAWLTAWSSIFDEFFWYSAVRLNSSWVETASISQAQSWWGWKLDITQLWTLTSGDNVMIKFPLRWIKMTKNWSIVTLSITSSPNKENEWFNYYAHNIGDFDNPWTPNSAFYLWTYKGYNSSSILKSWSWVTPTSTVNNPNFCTYAKANGSWYNIMGYYQRMFVNALYMMKYGNPNAKGVVWQWYVWGSWRINTWWTNGQLDATYWTTSNTTQAKLFWLEDRWGNLYEFLWGAYAWTTKRLYVSLNWWTWDGTYQKSTTINIWMSNYCISAIDWTNLWMFAPTWAVNNSSYNTYYYAQTYVSGWVDPITAWCAYNTWSYSNILSLRAEFGTTTSSSLVGARLMYMNWIV